MNTKKESPSSARQGKSLESATKVTKKQPYRKPEAVKLLELLVFTEKRIKYPNIPIDYMAPVTFRDDSANGLTKCVIDYIKLKHGYAERINTTGRPIDNTKAFTDVIGRQRSIGSITWIPGTGTNGSSDVAATINGLSVKIEIKVKRDIQSEAQKKYQHDVEAAGGLYYIAHDFTSFLTWYNLNFAQ